jgi:hypothetical protein
LQTIDPATGLPPDGAFAGFLPVNDSTGIGEGFVNYTIRPSLADQTGDSLKAKAEIVFDVNAPIVTNEALNIVDAVAPASFVQANVTVEFNSQITLNVNVEDDAGGSGVQYYDMYVSENGGPYYRFDSLITSSSVSFTGMAGNTYCFYSIGIDNVNNREPDKQSCELSVTLQGGPLPVSWLSFNAWQQQEDVLLKWATASEVNASHFIIERSVDGTNFSAIKRVNAAGGINTTTNYGYTDAKAALLESDRLYYRLRKVDADGSISYSVTISIPISRQAPSIIVQAYPNPFGNNLVVNIGTALSSDKVQFVQLQTITGKVVYSKIVNLTGSQQITIDRLNSLAQGIYILKVSVNNQVETIKLIHQ